MRSSCEGAGATSAESEPEPGPHGSPPARPDKGDRNADMELDNAWNGVSREDESAGALWDMGLGGAALHPHILHTGAGRGDSRGQQGREAALTLSCSSRLKLRASWSWTSSSGTQDGGWGREHERAGRVERGREATEQGGEGPGPECSREKSKALSLGRRQEAGSQRAGEAGREQRLAAAESRAEMRNNEDRMAGQGPPRGEWAARTWSASSLLMARASCSCSSSSPLLWGQACSASGGGPEPTAADEAADRSRRLTSSNPSALTAQPPDRPGPR